MFWNENLEFLLKRFVAFISLRSHSMSTIKPRLSSSQPVSVNLVQKYVALELAEAKPKMKRIRRAYDEALVQFGPKEIGIWIDYIKMELTHPKGCPSRVSHLHWRAIKDLDNDLVDEFSQKFAVVTNGLQLETGDERQ